jgi:hypothetical protein
MNIWRDAFESQEQKLKLILKDYLSKVGVKYLMTDFVIENYCLQNYYL